ncbi:MAG: isochorismatase family protein [Bdellovibrionales bacterium]|nr:isochorismatase family protein [Bdellovibrionales bacterium]
MFDGADKVFDCDAILNRIKRIEAFAKSIGLLTVYLQHAGEPGSPEEYGSETWKLHPGLSINGEVIGKRKLEAFESTKLNDVLKENKIEQVIICGMQSDHCVSANCKASVEHGYKTVLVTDAHSTCDSEAMSGKEVIAFVNEELKGISNLLTITTDLLLAS